MTAAILFFLSLSVAFPILVGFFRWRIIKRLYTPIMVAFCLGILVEIITRYALTSNQINWVLGNNFWILCESVIIPLQFSVWTAGARRKRLYYILIGILVLGWVMEHLILGSVQEMHPYFNMINYLVIHEDKKMVRQPIFIICTAFIIFFTYQLVYEGVFAIISNLDITTKTNLNTVFSIINSICNLLYGIALLLVPTGHIDWLDEKNKE